MELQGPEECLVHSEDLEKKETEDCWVRIDQIILNPSIESDTNTLTQVYLEHREETDYLESKDVGVKKVLSVRRVTLDCQDQLGCQEIRVIKVMQFFQNNFSD